MEFLGVELVGGGEGLLDGGFHGEEVFVVGGVEALFFDPLPVAFDEVEVGRVGGEEFEFDAEGFCVGLDELAALVAGVVEEEGDGDFQRGVEGGELVEQRADAGGVDVSFVGENMDLPSHSIERAEDVEALASAGRGQKNSRETPDVAHERAVNKVRGVYEKDHPLALFCL